MDIKTKTPPVTTAEPVPPWLAERNFIPAPSDPAQLTLADVHAAFAGDLSALKDIIKLAKEVQRSQTVPVTD